MNTEMDFIQLHRKQVDLDRQASLCSHSRTAEWKASGKTMSSTSLALVRSKQKLSTSYRLLSNSTNFNVGHLSTSRECGDHLVN